METRRVSAGQISRNWRLGTDGNITSADSCVHIAAHIGTISQYPWRNCHVSEEGVCEAILNSRYAPLAAALTAHQGRCRSGRHVRLRPGAVRRRSLELTYRRGPIHKTRLPVLPTRAARSGRVGAGITQSQTSD